MHESLASDNHQQETILPSTKKLKSPINKFDSIATLRQDTMETSYVTIPADKSGAMASKVDPDADTSSTKTEVEEMELDTFSDLEDNLRAHENVRVIENHSENVSFCGRRTFDFL